MTALPLGFPVLGSILNRRDIDGPFEKDPWNVPEIRESSKIRSDTVLK